MKASLLLCLFVALSLGQDTPPIWSITGGPIGIGSCYDIVTEDITFPAYEFHYETQNIMNVNNVNYLVPDEVFGYSSPEFVNDSRVIIMDTFTYYYHEYVSSWSISAGITIDGVTLNFAFSHTKGEIDGYLNNSINYFAENVLQWSQFTMEMWPGGTLHPHFLAEVNKLPLVYDPAAYGQFILYFGTHVIYKCFYGASINFTSVFHSDLVNKWGIEWVENQVKLSISYMQFNAGINWNDFSNTTSINDSFIEYAQNVTITVGGQPAYLEAYGFKAWWQSVQSNYAVLFPKAYIMPLSSIIPNPQIAANLKQAIIAYGNGKLPIANRRGKGNHRHKT